MQQCEIDGEQLLDEHGALENFRRPEILPIPGPLKLSRTTVNYYPASRVPSGALTAMLIGFLVCET